MAKDVVLFTRQKCPLCDDALVILQRYALIARVIDIDQHPSLKRKFDTCVPVVKIDGQIRFRGRINEVLLRRVLAES